MKAERLRVMLVLDPKLTKKDIFDDAEKAIAAGIPSIQYREKEKSSEEMLAECQKLKSTCAGKALFFINDNAELALAAEADGIHLGQDDLPLAEAREKLPNAIIGITVHNIEEAKKAEAEGADYVSVSPVFHTDTKADAGEQVGLEMVRKVKDSVSVPVMGIGGINSGNAKSVIEAGADSVAVVSCIVCSGDVFESSKKLLEAIK